MSLTQSTMLVICTGSWGEIDWVLPILHATKTRHCARIFVYFKRDWLLDQATQYEDLAAILHEQVEAIICPTSLLKGYGRLAQARILLKNWHRWLARPHRLLLKLAGLMLGYSSISSVVSEARLAHELGRHLREENVQLLLHDYTGVDNRPYYEAFPSARVVVFPHSTYQYGWLSKDTELLKQVSDRLHYETIDEDAIFLVGSPGDVPYFRQQCSVRDIIPVGYPKFESEWVRTIGAWGQKHGHVKDTMQSKSLILLFLSMPKRKVTGEGTFERIVETVLRIAHKYDLRLLIKKHPRQGNDEIEAIVRRFSGIDVEWVNTSVLCAAQNADLVINFPSSACMDAIAAGTPVIEFFDYSEQKWNSFIEIGGRKTSIYRHQGLVVPADTECELDAFVSRAKAAPHLLKDTLEQQQSALNRLQTNRGKVVDSVLSKLITA